MPAARCYADTGAEGLPGWLRVFLGRTSPRLILPLFAAAAVARLSMGGFEVADALVAAGFIVAQPFTEWLLHVFILHFRPREVGGRRLDLYIARKHRAHHVDPADIDLTLVAIPALLTLIGIVAAGILLGFHSWRLRLSAETTALALLLLYEWTHFLIHTPYVPRGALYRRVWRAHRLHHFKNEHYWFGITSHIADRVLRTFPDRAAVDTSATARTLAG